MQKCANDTDHVISVCHLPPGTGKWNKIEHRLFSYIARNWRGKPLFRHEVIVNIISSKTTRKFLALIRKLDTNKNPKGIKITDQKLREVNIIHDEFHGE